MKPAAKKGAGRAKESKAKEEKKPETDEGSEEGDSGDDEEPKREQAPDRRLFVVETRSFAAGTAALESPINLCFGYRHFILRSSSRSRGFGAWRRADAIFDGHNSNMQLPGL